MRLSLSTALVAYVGIASAASAWNFDEAIISVAAKGDATNAFRDKLSDHAPLAKPVVLTAKDSLKIVLTATEDAQPKRPHQAMLLLRDQITGLEDSFTFTVKDSGKARVELSQKDLPFQLLTSSEPLRATLLLASFGEVQAFSNHVFNLEVKRDEAAQPPVYNAPERLRAKPVINHIFKADPKNPPKVVSAFFTLVVVAALPVLLAAWVYNGANLNDASKAFSAAPIAHATFYGSVLAMEVLFYMYYTHLTLFELLPLSGVVGLVMFYSGSQALSEVQTRRIMKS